MKFHVVLVCLLCVFIAGCSTVVGRTSQKVFVTTGSVSNARCSLDTGKLRYQVITPATVHLERSKHDIVIKCSKYGYKPAHKVIKSSAVVKKAWSSLDKYTPGLGVDGYTRTIYSYPEVVDIKIVQKN